MYGMLYVLAAARAGNMHKLTFFTHVIDGKLYGAWYRVRSTTEVEVQAVGLMQIMFWEGRSPEAAAQCCLEDFISRRLQAGEPTPSLDEITAELHEAEPGMPSSKPTPDELLLHSLQRLPHGARNLHL